MLLTFQLFRLTYCGMFDKPQYSCKMGIRQKYFKRMKPENLQQEFDGTWKQFKVIS